MAVYVNISTQMQVITSRSRRLPTKYNTLDFLLMKEACPYQKGEAVIGWWDEFKPIEDEEGNVIGEEVIPPPPETIQRYDEEGNEVGTQPNPAYQNRGVWVDTTDYTLIKTKQAEEITFSYIQAIVDEYNTKNGLCFNNVYTCKAYSDEVDYPHQQFCKEVFTWNKDVWEAVRVIQMDILSGTIAEPETTEEFIALLPKYEGVI